MNNKIIFKKIVSIKKLGKRKTYDISVEDNHNFLLSNRILSHNSQDLTLFGKLVSEADKEAGTKQLYKDNFMTKRQIQDLSTLKPGEYYISESGKKVKKRYLLLPRTMYWKKGYGNFFDNVWKTLSDDWKDVTNVLEEIENDYQRAKKEIEEEEDLKKERARLEKEKKEQEKLEAQEKDKVKREEAKERIKNVRALVKGEIESSVPTDLEETMNDIQEIEKEKSIKSIKDSNIQAIEELDLI